MSGVLVEGVVPNGAAIHISLLICLSIATMGRKQLSVVRVAGFLEKLVGQRDAKKAKIVALHTDAINKLRKKALSHKRKCNRRASKGDRTLSPTVFAAAIRERVSRRNKAKLKVQQAYGRRLKALRKRLERKRAKQVVRFLENSRK